MNRLWLVLNVLLTLILVVCLATQFEPDPALAETKPATLTAEDLHVLRVDVDSGGPERIMLSFHAPMVDADELGGEPADLGLTLEPENRLIGVWHDEEALALTPARPLRRATRYTIHLGRAFIAPNGLQFVFDTPSVIVGFDIPVDESSLREKLEVSSRGRRVPVEVTDTQLADENSFRVVLRSAEDLDLVDVHVHAGMKPAQGDAGAMGVGEPADVPKPPGDPLVVIRGPWTIRRTTAAVGSSGRSARGPPGRGVGSDVGLAVPDGSCAVSVRRKRLASRSAPGPGAACVGCPFPSWIHGRRRRVQGGNTVWSQRRVVRGDHGDVCGRGLDRQPVRARWAGAHRQRSRGAIDGACRRLALMPASHSIVGPRIRRAALAYVSSLNHTEGLCVATTLAVRATAIPVLTPSLSWLHSWTSLRSSAACVPFAAN